MHENIMDIMGVTFENLKKLSGGGNILGEPVRLDKDVVVIPYCKVSLGFVYGGGEYEKKEEKSLTIPFAALSGGGVTLTPCGFLIAERGEYKAVSESGVKEDNKCLNLAKPVFNAMKKS